LALRATLYAVDPFGYRILAVEEIFSSLSSFYTSDIDIFS